MSFKLQQMILHITGFASLTDSVRNSVSPATLTLQVETAVHVSETISVCSLKEADWTKLLVLSARNNSVSVLL